MNTADRSIALMDTALRRRFQFIEMMPNSEVIEKLNANQVISNNKELDVSMMLDIINQRIEVLFDREHAIGHAFFTKLKDYRPEERLEVLSSIFKNKIFPLLQEYFYEDYSKIRLVLGDNGKKEEKYQFVKEIKNQSDIFKGSVSLDDIPEYRYELNEEAFNYIESYIEII